MSSNNWKDTLQDCIDACDALHYHVAVLRVGVVVRVGYDLKRVANLVIQFGDALKF
jgi:hypothetical protein